MPDAIVFPPLLMRERTASWFIAASTVSPGQTAAGAFPLTRLDGGGLWRADWRDVSLRTADHVRCFRAVAALAESGVMPIVVPQCDKRHFPAPVIDGVRVLGYDPVSHSDGSLFSDGSGYAQSAVVAQTVGAAVLRDTSLIIRFISGSALRGGEIFSIEHDDQGWRRYEIKTVAVNDDGDTVVTFRPPLRGDVADATDVEFDMPRCVMRLAAPDAMNLELDLRKFGAPSISFVEYFYS